MPHLSKRRILAIAAVLIVVAAGVWSAWPSAVPVDLAIVARSSMEVTIDAEARTQVRHVYVVSAPLSGTVMRADREAGDSVIANETVLALMRPTAPSFHDPRLHQELQSAAAAAEAAVTLADAERRRIEAALNLARSELARMESLTGQGVVAQSALDKAMADVQIGEAALASAIAALNVRRNERTVAAARLKNPNDLGAANDGCCVQIRAPATGQILKLNQESETVVAAGTPLMTIGNPNDLEIVAELLSTDAVQVKSGDPVRIDGWGGGSAQGRVRRVEPSGFVKVSALGIEEQRVRTLIDFVDSREIWSSLGHDYRVIVHIIVWRGENRLTVPIGALFRVGDDWAVFKVDGGRARTTVVKVGQRNDRVAEVTEGLADNDRIVVHASDRVKNGIRVAQRD